MFGGRMRLDIPAANVLMTELDDAFRFSPMVIAFLFWQERYTAEPDARVRPQQLRSGRQGHVQPWRALHRSAHAHAVPKGARAGQL